MVQLHVAKNRAVVHVDLFFAVASFLHRIIAPLGTSQKQIRHNAEKVKEIQRKFDRMTYATKGEFTQRRSSVSSHDEELF